MKKLNNSMVENGRIDDDHNTNAMKQVIEDTWSYLLTYTIYQK